MELRRITICLAFVLLAVFTQCSESRTHTVQRRDADPEPDINYDEPTMNDAASDDEAQNDADGGEDEDEEVDAVITNQGETFQVGVGRNVRLPCTINPSPAVNKAVAHQWSKDGTTIFIGTQKLGMNLDRMYIDAVSQSDLMIQDLQGNDAGEYTCEIVREQQTPPAQGTVIKHTLRVGAPPTIENITATDNGLVVEGSDVTISCAVTGIPPPKLIWSRESASGLNEKLKENDGVYSPNSVLIKSITREQAGKYICYADNNVGDPAYNYINIKVLGKPRVHVHRTVVNSDLNVEAILQCTAHEEPPAVIHWYKDGHAIRGSETYRINTFKQHSNLTVIPTSSEDFGVFSCVAENTYGSHNRTVELVQSPVIENFDAVGPKLSWTIHSHQPLEQIEVQLRELDGDGGDPKSYIVPVPTERSHQFEIVYVLDDKQLNSGKYEALVKVKNNYNWSGQTDPAVIEIEAQPQYIQHASVFGGSSGSSGHSTRPAFALLSTMITYLLIRFV